MSKIEEQLRVALRPKEAPPGFTERVLDLLDRRRPVVVRWRRPPLSLRTQAIPAVVAAALLAILVAGLVLHSRTLQDADVARREPESQNLHTRPPQSPDVIAEPQPVVAEKEPSRKPPRRTPASMSEGEMAKERLILAFHIAAAKLQRAQELVIGEE